MRPVIRALSFLAATLFLSCSAGTDPGECQSLDCFPAQYNLHLTHTITTERDFSFRELRGVAAFLRRGDRVSFANESDRVIPDYVSINGHDLPRGENDHLFMDIFHDSILAPPGEYNVWSAIDDGFADLPPLRDSIQTPADPIRIASPAVTDMISISEGFETRLAGFVDVQTPVELTVYQTSWYRNGGSSQHDTLLISNGPVHMTPELLQRSGIGAGEITIRIRQQYEKRRAISDELRALLTFTVEHDLTVTLID